MKILFGIQGTGNGHISRARMLAKYFNEAGADIDYLLTGRERDKFFDMDVFGNYLYRRGLTFHSENGRVSYGKTVFKNNILGYFIDLLKFDIKQYDLVITDFEPISAWSAKLAGIPVLGIGHQYAFYHDIPRAGGDPLACMIMKNFAPASISLGLHWDKFNGPILPPIVDTSIQKSDHQGQTKIVVYLPFENQGIVQTMLSKIPHYNFVIYSPELNDEEFGHLSLRKTSLKGFKKDLMSADGVICNSGFELISECLFLGIPVFSKPQQGQMEQQSNAEALRILDYATTSQNLSSELIANWLEKLPEISGKKMQYPDVAKAISEWVLAGDYANTEALSQQLWEQTEKQA